MKICSGSYSLVAVVASFVCSVRGSQVRVVLLDIFSLLEVIGNRFCCSLTVLLLSSQLEGILRIIYCHTFFYQSEEKKCGYFILVLVSVCVTNILLLLPQGFV